MSLPSFYFGVVLGGIGSSFLILLFAVDIDQTLESLIKKRKQPTTVSDGKTPQGY